MGTGWAGTHNKNYCFLKKASYFLLALSCATDTVEAFHNHSEKSTTVISPYLPRQSQRTAT